MLRVGEMVWDGPLGRDEYGIDAEGGRDGDGMDH